MSERRKDRAEKKGEDHPIRILRVPRCPAAFAPMVVGYSSTLGCFKVFKYKKVFLSIKRVPNIRFRRHFAKSVRLEWLCVWRTHLFAQFGL